LAAADGGDVGQQAEAEVGAQAAQLDVAARAGLGDAQGAGSRIDVEGGAETGRVAGEDVGGGEGGVAADRLRGGEAGGGRLPRGGVVAVVADVGGAGNDVDRAVAGLHGAEGDVAGGRQVDVAAGGGQALGGGVEGDPGGGGGEAGAVAAVGLQGGGGGRVAGNEGLFGGGCGGDADVDVGVDARQRPDREGGRRPRAVPGGDGALDGAQQVVERAGAGGAVDDGDDRRRHRAVFEALDLQRPGSAPAGRS